MAMVINTNALSLNAQNNLNKSQQSLNTAIERLSSGSRINSAKDDAAGLAISNRMNSQVTGLNQANRNANDGISAAQTAEGAMSQVTDNLQRIRELTVQAQNGTNQSSDLESIQNEITQRLEEVNRISEQTQFNGKTLLDGTSNSIQVQVGANDGQTIDLSLVSVKTTDLGVNGFDVSSLAKKVNTAAGQDADGSTAVTYDSNKAASQTNATSATLANGGDYTKKDGDTLMKSGEDYFIKSGDKYYAATAVFAKGAAEQAGPPVVPATNATFTVTGGAEVTDTATLQKLSPLATIDEALSKVDSARSVLGAQQNRLQSTIEGNATTSTNLAAAMSQIKDADYATEVSNMSKAQILQQAGTSVLAQANQTTQGVMSLLR